ncbi:hypothetical protein SDC9_37002 [bioreactor metagenome]|uniref:YqaJ viral recombinase domain-containing protein n=1 Tax=bioreactor metagenome TaxID=1076179 RepID=A0A644VHS2_9ZZZZ|nr:hypothetical protein [Lentimicrobium sp.]MEA5110404.1 hypothetical protein [Lentimicrobium sp.]
MVYRVSVSVLEKFRRFREGLTQFDTEEALLDAITGKFIGNDKTRIGGAFHKIIEKYNREFVSGELFTDGIYFSQEQAQVAVNYKNEHPNMVPEVPIFKKYDAGDLIIQVSARADGVEGLCIRDAKTKFSPPSAIEYINSFQWRFYLDMFQVPVFYYDLFEICNYTGIYNNRLPGVVIVPYEPLECLAYDRLAEDVHQLVRDFAEYIRIKNFTHLLKQVA